MRSLTMTVEELVHELTRSDPKSEVHFQIEHASEPVKMQEVDRIERVKGCVTIVIK